MGVADRHIEYSKGYRRKKFTLGQSGNAVIGLVGLNLILFIFILTGNVFYIFSHQGQGMEILAFNTIKWFELPAQFSQILNHPWSILTFMFAHGAGETVFSMLLHILSAMLWIWAFGSILQNIVGNRLIFPLYLYGGLLGGILFIIVANANPSTVANYYLFGANASIAALATGIATLDPDYRIFRHIRNGIPIWVLSLLYLIFNLSGILKATPQSFAIVGGALAGFGFIFLYKRGIDLGVWMHSLYNGFSKLFDPSKSKSIPKNKIFYNAGQRVPFTKSAIVTQKRIDALLDKINQHGIDSLSEEEKNILKKAAEADDL